MVAQAGKDLLLKIGDGEVSEAFTAIAGLRSKTISVNGTLADATNSDSTGRWREMIAGTGIKTFSISGSGVFLDAAIEATMQTAALAQTIDNYQAIIPAFGTFAGPFHISSMEYAGEHEGEVTYTISLESCGAVAFTAA